MNIEHYRVAPGTHLKLASIDPADTHGHAHDDAVQAATADALKRIGRVQQALYAEARHAVLIVLQALDAGGKDGTVRHVFGALNPLGAYARPFKVPTAEEAAHDFLWRVHRWTPAHGQLAIFNRSHYEDVLVVRVHDLVPHDVWSARYTQINAFEATLAAANTTILKFFLHISRDEQLRRFAERLDDPQRRWKISDADYAERAYWDAYMRAYEDAFAETSTAIAPWYVIPADHKWFRNYAVAEIVAQQLEQLDIRTPAPTVDLDKIRAEYHRASSS